MGACLRARPLFFQAHTILCRSSAADGAKEAPAPRRGRGGR